MAGHRFSHATSRARKRTSIRAVAEPSSSMRDGWSYPLKVPATCLTCNPFGPEPAPDRGAQHSPREGCRPGFTSPPGTNALARSARLTARSARFSRRSARSARRSFPGRRSDRRLARSAFVVCRVARSTARANRRLARSLRRLRRQARSLAASGQTSQATAPAPARIIAPRLPVSTPYQAPVTTAGSVRACRSQPACRTRRRTRGASRDPSRRSSEDPGRGR